ncbi:MAG TPA: hypothetical protein VHA70_01765 [Bauldia sp.]|nr:hypothetical protein [Bauldia sp.]
MPLRFVTADGTWDCTDATGAHAGVIVVAETTYAFIQPDGHVAGYGKLRLMTWDTTIPKFVVMSGYLKDAFTAYGLTMRGPKLDRDNLSGPLYLNLVLGGDGSRDWDCVRRGGRANEPPA